jgi:hypothetical protein
VVVCYGNNPNPASKSKAIRALDAHPNLENVKESGDGIITLSSSHYHTPLDGK